MIVGIPEEFAIESQISHAYEAPSLRALGFFNILLNGRRFGVREDDATMLANSFDEVSRRIGNRGNHVAEFGSHQQAADAIASAVISSLYCEQPSPERLLGMTANELATLVHDRRLVWAPDGDAAFDDRSFVLHFDVGDQVRLIAFKRGEEGLYDTASLVDQWVRAEVFYSTLQEWRHRFGHEWARHPKERPV